MLIYHPIEALLQKNETHFQSLLCKLQITEITGIGFSEASRLNVPTTK